MKQTLILLYIIVNFSIVAQEITVPKKTLKQIKTKALKNHLLVLTSDSLEGRNTGEEGGEKAASYIENYFKSIGIEPGYNGDYRQPFQLWETNWKDVSIRLGDTILTCPSDFAYMSNQSQNEETLKDIVYLGAVNDSSEIPYDITDKIAFVKFEDLKRSLKITAKLKKAGAWAVFGINTNNEKQYQSVSKKSRAFNKRTQLRYEKPQIKSSDKRFFIFPNTITQTFFRTEANLLPLLVDSTMRPITCRISLKMQSDTIPVEVYNIVGKISGKNSESKSLVITAHYDHVGRDFKGRICRGADDNGSGTAALMQLAKSFIDLKQTPENDILFVAFTGEEKGLWGSKHFMEEENPDDYLANINMDMIGRHDTITKDNYIYILGVGKSPWIDSLSREANKQTVKLEFDYHYDGGSFMNRSDHYHFYRHNIPVLTFFSGLHNDYHTNRDTMDKIDFKLYRRRVQLIFASAYMIAYDPEAIKKANQQ